MYKTEVWFIKHLVCETSKPSQLEFVYAFGQTHNPLPDTGSRHNSAPRQSYPQMGGDRVDLVSDVDERGRADGSAT